MNRIGEKLTPEKIINGDYISVEKLNSERIKILKWGEFTDVLYSFCGIFSLGIYIKEKNKYSVGADKRIRVLPNNKQWLSTHKNIKENLNLNKKAYKDLARSDAIIEFAKVYNTIGNVIPIWPGGNEFKGKVCVKNSCHEKEYCYDIPDMFFNYYGYMEKVYIENILKKSIVDVALTRFITNKPPANHIKSIDEILNYNDIGEYYTFVSNIVNEINKRNMELEDKLKI